MSIILINTTAWFHAACQSSQNEGAVGGSAENTNHGSGDVHKILTR